MSEIFPLLQSALTLITKCVSFFVLQSVLKFVTKCVRSFITKCVEFYYKVRQVLQSASRCITKCVRYYKVWRLLQSELVQFSSLETLQLKNWSPNLIPLINILRTRWCSLRQWIFETASQIFFHSLEVLANVV